MRLLYFFIAVLFALFIPFLNHGKAEVATSEEMRLVCENWLSYIVHETGSWAGSKDPHIESVDEIIGDGGVLALNFTIAPNGHVVVPILKELPPIKAYSEKCTLIVDHDVGFPQLMRDALSILIQTFIDTYGSIYASQPLKGEVLFDRANRREWDYYLVDCLYFDANVQIGPIGREGPLLTSKWHQNSPYNDLCPELTPNVDEHCVVGCVATAMAQIMNYYEWPLKGVGNNSVEYKYRWRNDWDEVPCVDDPGILNVWPLVNRLEWTPANGGKLRIIGYWDNSIYLVAQDEEYVTNINADYLNALTILWNHLSSGSKICSSDFENTAYQWDLFNDEHSDPPDPADVAVATLCYHVGVSVGMEYGAYSSGTHTWKVIDALVNHFRYDPSIEQVNRDDPGQTAQTWFALIKSEIDAGRPMQYRIIGHSIVCDD